MKSKSSQIGAIRATIYSYFSNKHEIYGALIEDTLRPLIETCEKIAETKQSAMMKLRQIVELLVDAGERHYPFLFLYTQEDMRGRARSTRSSSTTAEVDGSGRPRGSTSRDAAGDVPGG